MKNAKIKFDSRNIIYGSRLRAFSFTASLIIVLIVGGLISGCISRLEISEAFKADIFKISAFVVSASITLILFSLIKQAEEAWHICKSNGKEPSFTELLFWLKPSRFIKAFMMNSVLLILKSLWVSLLSAPGAFLITVRVILLTRGEIGKSVEITLLVSGIVSLVCGLFFSFCINQRYFLCRYLLAKNPGCSISAILKNGTEIMNKNCIRALMFRMGFIPWYLLCTTFVALLYVVPYYRQSCVILKKQISESFYEQKLSE